MIKSNMLKSLIFAVVAVLIIGNDNYCLAFSSKTMERTRPAFKKTDVPSSQATTTAVNSASAASAGGGSNSAPAPFGVHTTAAHGPSARPSSSSVAHYYEDHEDDEAVIYGYGTIVLSCALSIALGFSIGYGT